MMMIDDENLIRDVSVKKEEPVKFCISTASGFGSFLKNSSSLRHWAFSTIWLVSLAKLTAS